MKALIDCVPLTVGGGVQVAIGVLTGMQRQSAVEWSAVAPTAMRSALPSNLAEDARITFVQRRSQADRVWLTPFLTRLERKLAPDVVFTVFGPPFFHARAPHLVGFALPRLIYERDADMPRETVTDRLGNELRAALFRRADHIVVETAVAKMRFADRVGFAPERISIIPNGPNPLLQRLPEPEANTAPPFVILIPSAYYGHKNLEIVPAVAAAMRERMPSLEFVFRFMLPEASVQWRGIKGEAERLGVGDALLTLGVVKITDLAAAYHGASAVYLPTLREISTAVYPESFLFRRPLVTTDMDFARELCADAAILVPPRKIEEAADRLVHLATSPNLRAELVAAGNRQLVAAYPTAEAKFQMQLDLMSKVAGVKENKGRVGCASSGRSCPEEIPVATHQTAAVRFHDRLAAEWEAKYASGRFRKRAEFFVREILPAIQHNRGRWLDAGCGTGHFSRLLAKQDNEVVGVDASEFMIQAAERVADGSWFEKSVRFEVVETVERLRFESETFDGALCLSVLEYLEHPADCLNELHRILKPGAPLVISLPHRLAPTRLVQRAAFSALGDVAPTKWEYATFSRYASTGRSLDKTLHTHGFRLTKALGFDSAMPAPLLKLIPASLIFAIAVKETPRDNANALAGVRKTSEST